MSSEANKSSEIRNTLFIAAIPAAVAVFNLVVFARGDYAEFLTLLQNVDILKVWLATAATIVLLLGPVAPAFYAATPLLHRAEHLVVQANRLVVERFLGRCAVCFALSVLIAWLLGGSEPGFYIIPGLLYIVLLAQWALVKHPGKLIELTPLTYRSKMVEIPPWQQRASLIRRNRFATAWYATCSVICVAVMLLYSSENAIGRPRELVKISDDGDTLSEGYVLNVDDISLTLAYSHGGIRYIPTGKIEGRYECGALLGTSSNGITKLMDWWNNQPQAYYPDECWQGIPVIRRS